MEKREQLYEGKAKILYATDDPDLLVQYFKDDATAFNRKKTGTIENKGEFNCRISTVIFRLLEREGVRTHWVKTLNDREMLVKRLTILPVEVVVRNRLAGSLAKRLGLEEGRELSRPLVEFYYKCDELDDPLMTDDQVDVLGFATGAEVAHMRTVALKVDEVLSRFFLERGIILVDYKIEFGRHKDEVLLGDEISPDSCRLWEVGTLRKLDKDRFRRDMGSVEEAYAEVLSRVET
ncbi:MAG: phosphoribosylaminoimidazolesuccinocarboxamide synthase [Deltaproteobacteria bacterium]|nr:phosphoribosylaminoimidazolesuccinocarboxamide synthase [Deltaproteobacteria bacterium]